VSYESLDERRRDFVKDIDLYFNQSSTTLQEGRNIIRVVEYENRRYIVKSFKEPNIINKIAYRFFRKSKAYKSYFNSLKISDFVPRAIGYREFKKFGFITKSYFISEKIEYYFTIREPLLDDNFSNREAIFRAFANFSSNLHKKGILHLDFSPGNILIKKENSSYIFKIIDINRMQFKTLDLEQRLKNFAKLWAKDEDLEIIIKEYATIIAEDKNICLDIALKYSHAHKARINAKKKRRGQAVVD